MVECKVDGNLGSTAVPYHGLEVVILHNMASKVVFGCVSFLVLDRRRTTVQQLTCKIDLSDSFYYLFFSFVLIELKPFVLKGKVPGKNSEKMCEKVRKIVKIMKRFCPLVVAL